MSRFISEMVQDRAIVTMADQLEVVCGLSNGAFQMTSSDLERNIR